MTNVLRCYSYSEKNFMNIFYNFNKNADRATEILLKKEASNESLSYLRADLFEDRNRALALQRKINDIKVCLFSNHTCLLYTTDAADE